MNDNIIQNTSQEEKLLDIYYEQRQNAQDASVTFDKQYAKTFGINGGIFLSILGRHCKPSATGGKVIDGERWAYNTYEGWCEYYFEWLNPQALQKVILKLEKDGYVFSCQPDGTDKKKYYRPNPRKIIRAVANNYPWDFPLVQPDGLIEHEKSIRSNNTKSYDVNRNTVNAYSKTKLLLEADEKISENQNEIGKVFKAYEGEIGILTPMVSANIQEALEVDNIPPDWIVTAIGEASRNNKRNWAYVSAILKNWKANGFQTDKGKPQGKAKGSFKKPKYDMGDYEVSHASEEYFVDDGTWDEGDDYELQF